MASPKSKVIVVGGGLSGLSAAHTILERGANVLLLDKNGFMGGNSTKATSGINGAGTSTQAENKVYDSVAAFYDDTVKSAKDLARPDLIKVLVGQSASAVEWLKDTFNLDLSLISRLGGHSFERTHRGKEMFPGMTITYAQMERLEEIAEKQPDRATIIKKARVFNLIKEGDKVVGVEYEHKGKNYKEYGPVVLATGGYANDFEGETSLLAKYRPDVLKLSTTNGDHCTGDGHKMVMGIGGNGIDLEKVQVHPTGLVDPNEPKAKVKFLAAEALRGVGGLLLEANGKRFCDELGRRDYVSGEMWKNKFPIRLVLNGKASKEIEWHCKHYTGRGLMKKFNSGEELAKEIGCSAATLKATFDDYNEIASGKKKDPYGKKFFHNGPLVMDDIFHVALMEPVVHYTMGGIEIDAESRIKDTKGNVIPGLFACGELAGGVHGANRLGGSSLLGCVVYGRVAGASATAHLTQELVNGSAAGRLGNIAGHLLETRVRVDPEGQKLNLEFVWGGQGASSSSGVTSAPSAPTTTAAGPSPGPNAEEKKEKAQEKKADKAYSLDEVAKHNKDDDVWVAINGQVLNVTDFLDDHPGGRKAILLYKGKDASEEFNMLHKPDVIQKYAPDTVVGSLKK